MLNLVSFLLMNQQFYHIAAINKSYKITNYTERELKRMNERKNDNNNQLSYLSFYCVHLWYATKSS